MREQLRASKNTAAASVQRKHPHKELPGSPTSMGLVPLALQPIVASFASAAALLGNILMQCKTKLVNITTPPKPSI